MGYIQNGFSAYCSRLDASDPPFPMPHIQPLDQLKVIWPIKENLRHEKNKGGGTAEGNANRLRSRRSLSRPSHILQEYGGLSA